MAGHVGDDDADRAVLHREIVEVIAARFLGGIRDARDVEALDGRRRFGKKPLLNFPRDLQLLLVFPQRPLGFLARGDVAHESHMPPLAVQIHVAETDLDDDLVAVLAPPDGLNDAAQASFFARAKITLDALRLVAPQFLRQQNRQRPPDNFLLRVAEDGFHGGVGEVNFALRIHEQHCVGRGFPEQAVAQFALQKFRARLASLAPVGRLADFALNRRGQPAEVAFHQVVVRARLHRRHRRRFADAAGDDDERHVELAGLENRERLGRAEVREVVVGKNHVPRFLAQGAVHAVAGFHALGHDLVAALADVTRNDLGVELRVLDDQDTQHVFHRSRNGGDVRARRRTDKHFSRRADFPVRSKMRMTSGVDEDGIARTSWLAADWKVCAPGNYFASATR